MQRNAFDATFDELPPTIAIFPLAGAMLLPRQQLPLNIFEPRYLNMIFDALKTDRHIGMIQPRPDDTGSSSNEPPVFDVGCAGRITAFNETDDGRVLISLRGVCRFSLREELDSMRGYRRVQPDWSRFRADLDPVPQCDTKPAALHMLMEGFLARKGLEVRWNELERLPLTTVIDFLCVNVPFAPEEKQALLEAASHEGRMEILRTIVQLDAAGGQGAPPADAPRH